MQTSSPQKKIAPSRFQKFIFFVSYLFFLLLITEISLRIQQWAGPMFDLEFSQYHLDSLSYDVNHRPDPPQDFNEFGIRFNPERSEVHPDTDKDLTILFMGDSFMQGFSADETIPEYVRHRLQTMPTDHKLVTILNAGCSSYSPSIYIVQAKKLIPHYRPDLVVIDLDETDLVDDYACYKPLLKRDNQNKIIGVGPSPINETKIKGLVALKNQPFYTLRLLGFFLHKGIRVNWLIKTYRQKERGKYYAHPLSESDVRHSYNLVPSFDEAPDAKQKYTDEIRHFETTLRELIETLINLMGSADKILLTHHPHLHHLVADSKGLLWKSYVTEITKKTAAEYGVSFYDATEDLKKSFGKWPVDFYFPHDMHLKPEGLKIYADHLSEKLQPLIERQT